ncbi:MAG: uridine monophosphate kinase [Clostridiales bacterium]|jgi:uridylate kinase|nr:uridine monophosphate kinase [Clostridiales bacterium]
MFNRVLIKLSGEALSGGDSGYYDQATVSRVAKEIIQVQKNGCQPALVLGGGNYWRGAQKGLDINRAKSDQIGMLATIMNALYMCEIFKLHNAKAVVMTPFICGNFTKPYSQDEADSYLNGGYILIFAGGLGHPYFSTDTIAAVRAVELNCDAILYAKTIDGVYDSDPKINPGAAKFKNITYKEIIEKDLKVIDIAAMNICNNLKMPSVAFDLSVENGIVLACSGDDGLYAIGTKITYK